MLIDGKSFRFKWSGSKERVVRPKFAYSNAYLSLSRRTLKMDMRVVGWGGMDWIALTQDKDRWRAVVSAVMNLRVL
jgi:hypothetical protein